MRQEFLTEDEIQEEIIREEKSDKKQKRTAQQIEAIYSFGQNILVSASAGSGKTFVMVERIMDKIRRGIEIDSLFISTFTVKAATEFKERLDKKLIEEIKILSQQTSIDQDMIAYLSRQRMKLHTADIGTMDAFTQKLLQEFGYRKGIGAGFRILQDRNEQVLIKNRLFSELVEEYFERFPKEFSELIAQYTSGKKSLDDFREQVYKIYNFIQSTDHPLTWLQEHFLEGYKTFTSLSSLPNREFEEAKVAVYAMANVYQTMLESGAWFNKNGSLSAKGKKGEQVLAIIPDLLASLDKQDSPYFCSQIEALLSAKLVSKSGEMGLYSRFTGVSDFYEKYRHMEVILTHQPKIIPHLELLRQFVTDFYTRYLDEKISEGQLEFADISHLAIAILTEFSDVRKYFQDKYHEVMVDEYQDTNSIQESILDLISQGHNRFMVGDIKQSIYGFRQADPLIFREKLDTYHQKESTGKVIHLLENFRSQLEVLDATNKVFEQLMDREVGEIDYDDNQALQAGSERQKETHTQWKTECLIYNKGTADEEIDSQYGEFQIVAKEIIRLYKEENVSFEDIAILVRNKSHNNAIVSTFNQYNIPIAPDERQPNYLKSIEIMVMLDTLRVIDNPLNDISLVALMHSPMFQFNEDELMRIRLQDVSMEGEETSSLTFYQKIGLSLSGMGEQRQLLTDLLIEKIQFFLTTLQSWRDFARTHSLYDLIWKIYNDRYYYDYVGGLPDGEQRQVNLYALAIRANSYESTGYKGVSRFVNMIDKLVHSGTHDLDDVPMTLPSQAVKLMTIHKSKGLEFKYVFLLNLASKFNAKDTQAKLILDKTTGIGSKQIVDMKSDFPDSPFPFVNVSMETLPYMMNKEKLLVSQRSEEMRLLYVGMTRAERKLYLVASADLSKKEEVSLDQIRTKEFRVYQSHSFFDWLYALRHSLSQAIVFREYTSEDLQDLIPLEFEVLKRETQLLRMDDKAKQAKEILDSVDRINQSFQAGIDLPALQTPSQVKKLYEPILQADELVVSRKFTKEVKYTLPDLNKKNQKVSATELGSAVHELMQRLNLKNKITQKDLAQTLDKVQVDAAVKKAINLDKLYLFFQTELGKMMQKYHPFVKKEMPFSMLKEDPVSHEKFVIRGIVDGFILLEDRIVLFDYKTDHFTKIDKVVKIRETYIPQMNLYAEALKLAYGVNQIDKYLILLGGPEVRVEKL